MVRAVGGREATLKNGKPHCIVLDDEQRGTIKAQKGDSSISEFVRECIDLRITPKDGDEREEELRSLKEEAVKQTKQLKQYEQAERKRQKVNEEQLAYIGKRYKEWEMTTALNSGRTRLAWAQGCVHGLPISPEEALCYLQGEGYFKLE